jgi:ABC-2 type transport system ATP-binding protein
MSVASKNTVHVAHLSKTYQVPERPPGIQAAVRSLFKRQYKIVHAVADLSFDIAAGEVVGFLGPNGAGKTTTLKMLAGMLYPSTGEVQVLGQTPSLRPAGLLRQISLVMGNRNQLFWDLPALDSFELARAMYGISLLEFRQTLQELLDLLDLHSLVKQPVRNLSLGERMKLEFVGALLHRPKVLFLDEPTIGLDVTMQQRLRAFVAEYNRRYNATVLLTSHYMADVEALCQRVIVIHHGKMLYDGSLSGLVQRFAPSKTISVTLAESAVDLQPYGDVLPANGTQYQIRVPKAQAPQVAARLLADFEVLDLTIAEPPIETVIAQVFAQQAS